MSAREQQRSRIFLTSSQATNMLAFMLALAAVLSIAQAAGAQTFRLLYQFKSGRDGDNPYSSLILDAEGNLYGTTMIDGAYSYGTGMRAWSGTRKAISTAQPITMELSPRGRYSESTQREKRKSFTASARLTVTVHFPGMAPWREIPPAISMAPQSRVASLTNSAAAQSLK